MRVIVLKKNRSNKRGPSITTATVPATATTAITGRDLSLKKAHSKKDLFVSKLETSSPRTERKYLTSAAPPSMKTKWLRAIKSLKPASGSAAPADRRNGPAGASSSQQLRLREDGNHHLQEYTYKKITACDVCSQILRGHTRQGLRCRICKLNAHGDCAAMLPRCQPKQKLMRRQKSTTELEHRIDMEEEKLTDIEQVYRALKQAGDLKKRNYIAAAKSVHQSVSKDDGPQRLPDIPIVRVLDYPERSDRPEATGASQVIAGSSREAIADGGPAVVTRPGVRPPPVAMPILGVQLQQQELQRSGLGGGGTPTIAGLLHAAALPVPSHDLSSSSAPSSPSHHRRKLLYATRGMRDGSMDLPGDIEKSQSSASTSPCPSPRSRHQMPPSNVYVTLYNFKARHADELDLKAGYKVTVIDTSDPDWWKGKSMGRIGYFPSKYVTRLNANEKPYQVTHNLEVSDGGKGDTITLLQDQIVIQTGDEMNGMALVRLADNSQGYCPIKYLQEV